MVRPKRVRRICFRPDTTYFKPAGIPLVGLEESMLSFDEIEAMRLIDSEEMSQDDAAKRMKISQSTLSRIIKSGRKSLTGAIVNGNAIRIQGGNFKLDISKTQFDSQRRLLTKTVCRCPSCEYEKPHMRGHPCAKMTCPKCKIKMVRMT